MKYAFIAIVLISLGFFITLRSDPPEAPEEQNNTVRTTRNRPAESLHINDPPAPPIRPIRPEDMGVSPSSEPVDHPARITRALSENDLSAVQFATLAWFEKDPAAARDWLASQPTLESLQPAIAYIVISISGQGDHDSAVEWSALLNEGTLRDDTLFDIHALALRNGKITPSEVPLHLIPAERQDELLGGAAGD
jgi:hypothetical protein